MLQGTQKPDSTQPWSLHISKLSRRQAVVLWLQMSTLLLAYYNPSLALALNKTLLEDSRLHWSFTGQVLKAITTAANEVSLAADITASHHSLVNLSQLLSFSIKQICSFTNKPEHCLWLHVLISSGIALKDHQFSYYSSHIDITLSPL